MVDNRPTTEQLNDSVAEIMLGRGKRRTPTPVFKGQRRLPRASSTLADMTMKQEWAR